MRSDSLQSSSFLVDTRQTKGQVRATTLKETAKAMRDFTACIGDIDVQEVRYEHGERFIQHYLDREVTAATVTKKVKHVKRVFQLAEDRGQLDWHPLRRLKLPKVARRKIRVFKNQEYHSLCKAAKQYEEKCIERGC